MKIVNVLIKGLIIIFLIIELVIICFSFSKCEDNADYVIVLGSGVSENGLSTDYKRRLDKAYDYLIKNNNTLVITTGGIGHNEPIEEAIAGKNYLVSLGIKEDRIIVEDNSFNTIGNLNNTKNILKDDISNKKIVIISSGFHLFRASMIANSLGYRNVSYAGSLGVWYLWPYSYIREFFALIKDFVVLNILR